MLVVSLLVSVGLVAAGVLPVQQYLERENEVRAAQERLDRLVEENAALSDDASALLSEQEVERIAREQYGFVRPGEIGYIVITPDDAEIVEAPVVVSASGDEDRNLLQRFWDFVTGNDADIDG
jgi:cell division protein FtsB